MGGIPPLLPFLHKPYKRGMTLGRKSKDQHFHQICEDKPCTLANRAGGGGGRWTLTLETAGYYPLQMTLVCQFEHTCPKAENPPFPHSLLLSINLKSFIFILILKISKKKKKFHLYLNGD